MPQHVGRIQRLLFRYSESVFIPTPSFGRNSQQGFLLYPLMVFCRQKSATEYNIT